MERGEVDGYPSIFWSSLASTRPDWIKNKMVKFIVQYGPEKEADLPDVPYAPDFVKNPDDKALFEAAYGPLAAGRPFLMPPEVPADRLAAMRKAFMDTFRDEAFKADAKAANLIVDKPRSGEELQAQIARAYQAPPQVIARLRKIANPE